MILIKKPWGKEELLEKNKKFMVKRLFMKKGHRCSLQYHNKKKETIFVLSGKLKVFFLKYKNFTPHLYSEKAKKCVRLNQWQNHRLRNPLLCSQMSLATVEW